MARKSTGGRSRSKKKSTSVKVDFTGVETSRKAIPEDDYLVEVVEAEKGESNSGNEQITLTFEVVGGKHKGAKLWLHCPLLENSLWKLRSVLECLGVEVPDDEMDIELPELIGLQMMAVVHHEKYEGKIQSKIGDFYSADEEDADEEEDEEEEEEEDAKPARRSRGKKSSKKSKSDEEEDEEDEEEDEEDEEEEEEEDPEERKKRLRRERRAARKEGAGKTSSSRKSSKKSKKKSEGITADDIQDMDEDGLEELVEAHELDLDLADFKTLRKKQAAVIDAMEEAELLE